MIRSPSILTITALLGLAGCDGIPQAEKEAPALTRSASCQVGGDDVYGRPDRTPVATIAMNNDGGWCWMNSTESQWGRVYGPWLTVLRQPEFGTLKIDVTEANTRVAYRPNPGFVGTDTFKTRSRELNYDVEYRVVVTK